MKYVPMILLAYFLLNQKISEASYQVQVGDTLTQIAESKYGNWIKWQDLWEANRAHLPNPNLIYPGQRLRLLTEEELDLYAANDQTGSAPDRTRSANDGDGPTRIRNRSGRSQEWRLLPQQSWEKFVFKLSPAIDPDGFDRRSRVAVRVADKSAADVTIASDRIPVMGEITNARTEYDRAFLGEQVFIRADEQLQVGTVYSVTTGPQKLVSRRDGRVGFAYDLTGKVKIIGVRDGLFIGTLIALYHPIQRHQLLIPEVADYQFLKAVPAKTPLPAIILTPQYAREDLLGEQKIVFLDVGSNDGVMPGTIFRHYLHVDPATHETISTKDFLIESEIEVLKVLDKFSVAIILKSHSVSHFGDDLVALTDLKDFERNQGLQTILQDGVSKVTVDDLDQMDSTDGLGEKENHDLRQLEKWSKPSPDSAPVPGVEEGEIQRVDTHDHPRQAIEIGKEPAPDDGSAQRPPTAPSTNASAPPPTASPAQATGSDAVLEVVPPPPPPPPEAVPNPSDSVQPVVPMEDSLGPTLNQSKNPSPEAPPIQKTNPLPTADPFETPKP